MNPFYLFPRHIHVGHRHSIVLVILLEIVEEFLCLLVYKEVRNLLRIISCSKWTNLSFRLLIHVSLLLSSVKLDKCCAFLRR